MQYNKYSRFEFDELGLDTPRAEALAQQLEQEVTRELHDVCMQRFEHIISRLNALGHRLSLYHAPEPGDVEYRQSGGDGENGLRLAYSIVVASGFAHLRSSGDMSIDEVVEEIRDRLKKQLGETELPDD